MHRARRRAFSTGGRILALVLVLGLAGCSWTGRDGARHVVILGFGMVSQTYEPGIVVEDHAATGPVRKGDDSSKPCANPYVS